MKTRLLKPVLTLSTFIFSAITAFAQDYHAKSYNLNDSDGTSSLSLIVILIISCFGIWFLIKFLLINSTLDNQKKENNVGCYILMIIALIFGVILGIYSLIH